MNRTHPTWLVFVLVVQAIGALAFMIAGATLPNFKSVVFENTATPSLALIAPLIFALLTGASSWWLWLRELTTLSKLMAFAPILLVVLALVGFVLAA